MAQDSEDLMKQVEDAFLEVPRSQAAPPFRPKDLALLNLLLSGTSSRPSATAKA